MVRGIVSVYAGCAAVALCMCTATRALAVEARVDASATVDRISNQDLYRAELGKPLQLTVEGPMTLPLTFYSYVVGDTASKTTVAITLDGKPFKRFSFVPRPMKTLVPNSEWRLARGGTVKLAIESGSHSLQVNLIGGPPALGVRIRATIATVEAAATPAPSPTPAPDVVTAEVTDQPPPGEGIAHPLVTRSALARGRWITVGLSGGYLYSGGDVAGALFGFAAGIKPLPRSRTFRRIWVTAAVERYAFQEVISDTDEILGLYERSYELTVIPIYVGVAYRQPLGSFEVVGELAAGAFLVDGFWRADNDQGAIEPPTQVRGAPIGLRAGAGVIRRIGRSDLGLVVRYRQAAFDNGETLDPVYPASPAVYEILGDLAGWSASLGYSFVF